AEVGQRQRRGRRQRRFRRRRRKRRREGWRQGRYLRRVHGHDFGGQLGRRRYFGRRVGHLRDWGGPARRWGRRLAAERQQDRDQDDQQARAGGNEVGGHAGPATLAVTAASAPGLRFGQAKAVRRVGAGSGFQTAQRFTGAAIVGV